MLPNLLNGRDVCYHIYMISAHKRHVWTIRTCPTTILLSTVTMCMSVCMNGSTEGNCKRGSVPHEACGPVCSPGVDLERVAPSHTGVTQLSGWPELHNILKHIRKQALLLERYINAIKFKFMMTPIGWREFPTIF